MSDVIWLNDKQEKFCQALIASDDYNCRTAAKIAGYNNPDYGYTLMRNKKVMLRLGQLKAGRNRRYQVDADKVLKRLEAFAFANIGDYFNAWGGSGRNRLDLKNKKQLTRIQQACIKKLSEKRKIFGRGKNQMESIEFDFEIHDQHRALIALMAHLGIDRGEPSKDSAEDLAKKLRQAAESISGAFPDFPDNGVEADDGDG